MLGVIRYTISHRAVACPPNSLATSLSTERSSPAFAPAVIADVVATLRVVGPGTVPGRLYHLGGYPGCILDGDCGAVIHGQVLEIPDESVLERLDWYEGYAATRRRGQSLPADGVRRHAGGGRSGAELGVRLQPAGEGGSTH